MGIAAALARSDAALLHRSCLRPRAGVCLLSSTPGERELPCQREERPRNRGSNGVSLPFAPPDSRVTGTDRLPHRSCRSFRYTLGLCFEDRLGVLCGHLDAEINRVAVTVKQGPRHQPFASNWPLACQNRVQLRPKSYILRINFEEGRQ